MKFSVIAFTCAAACASTASAIAQTAPTRFERPYRGLFGGGVGNAEHLLKVTVGVGAGYDDNLLSDNAGSQPNPLLMKGGPFGAVDLDISYSRRGDRLGLTATGTAATRWSRALVHKGSGAYTGAFSAALQASRSTRVTASQQLAYQPLFSAAVLPTTDSQLLDDTHSTAQPPADLDWSISRDQYMLATTTVDVTQSIGRRVTFSAGASQRSAQFNDSARDMRTQTGTARVSYGVARGLSVRLGYEYSSSGAAAIVRNLDAGVDVQRALGRTRRTKVSFASGSTAATDQVGTKYRATVNAGLSREFGRSWNASLRYRRSARFTEQFLGPIFADEASVGVQGMSHRRVQWESRVTAMLGEAGTSGADNQFDTYAGSVGATIAVSRYTAVAITYAFTRYRVDAMALTRVDIPRQTSRHSIQVRFALWSPLFHRARRSDAAR